MYFRGFQGKSASILQNLYENNFPRNIQFSQGASDRPLKILEDQIYQTTRFSFSFDSVTVRKSRFININSNSKDGGAIIAFSSLNITDSLFQKCTGNRGGAISSHAAFDLSASTFDNCIAKQAGSFYVQSNNAHVISIDGVLCQQCTSDLFGTYYKNAEGETTFTSSNISNSRANECVGSGELKGGTMLIKYNFYIRSSARVHNGCLCIRDPATLELKFIIWYECSHQSDLPAAGAALLVYNCPYRASISNSALIRCIYSNSYSISVDSGFELLISDTCLTGPESRELRTDNSLIEANIVISEAVCTEFSQLNGKTIGFLFKENQRFAEFFCFMLSAGLALVLAYIANGLHVRYCKVHPFKRTSTLI